MDMDSGSKMYYIYTFLLLVITDMPGKYVARDCNIKSMQQYTKLGFIGTLWHKVDISIFQRQKNVNFCNIFVGKMIADDLKSKIWKVCGNFF